MQYTVQKLADLAGVSGRTLRYYDQIGLLSPVRSGSGGYRIYGPDQVDRLQQILFYRELGLDLAAIGRILSQPGGDGVQALRSHHQKLLAQRDRLDTLINTVEKTIHSKERGISMQDTEKFDGFTQKLVQQNEAAYGAELRAAYGDEAVDSSNQKLLGMSREAFALVQALEQQVLDALDNAYAAGATAGPLARKLVALHKQWLCCTWADYTPQAHRGVADLYTADERFAAYYDRGTPGKAAFLRDAVYQLL